MRPCPWLVIPLLLGGAGWIPALSAPVPIRQVSDQTVWSTQADSIRRFVLTGEIRDRGLEQLIKSSGWQADELRIAIGKIYQIDSQRVARFLASERGERFLLSQLGTYGPAGAPAESLVGLRSAILTASADGALSAADLLDHLPTNFDLRRRTGTAGATMPVCGSGGDLTGDRRNSWLSWLVFLPACLQAASLSPPSANTRPVARGPGLEALNPGPRGGATGAAAGWGPGGCKQGAAPTATRAGQSQGH